ncbi:MAG: UDP-N-acetylglucosamine 2-epimerase (non-hydrolyzing) [Nitrospirae bacterium]|nr:UDP-N-acetylglucosamine 2-epimerase (non-hydrolyzing) [Nitrospirota bacterium]
MADKLKWILVAGARPNFMKIAPLIKEIERYNTSKKVTEQKITPLLVHTGQHYDKGLSKVFFDELNIPKPDVNLGVGSGSHGEQTGKIMISFEKVAIEHKPDLVIVVGDVNSTIACALVSAKLCIPVAHVEAGLRSFDRSMPEEINRILTDRISDYLFTPSEDANKNLLNEGIPVEKIFLVGNIMVDSLMSILPYVQKSGIFSRLNGILPQKDAIQEYALLTLHRPSNVDDKKTLNRELGCLGAISKSIPILFPVHPRTKKQIQAFGLEKKIIWLNDEFQPLNHQNKNYLYGLPPLGYLDFMALMNRAKVIFTDSGGIQEESTVMGIPCITLRENTERPVTVQHGTNILAGTDPEKIREAFVYAMSNSVQTKIPELWDGKTAKRIVTILTSSQIQR